MQAMTNFCSDVSYYTKATVATTVMGAVCGAAVGSVGGYMVFAMSGQMGMAAATVLSGSAKGAAIGCIIPPSIFAIKNIAKLIFWSFSFLLCGNTEKPDSLKNIQTPSTNDTSNDTSVLTKLWNVFFEKEKQA